MQILGTPKLELRSETYDYINLFKSLGEQAENFIPNDTLNLLKNFVRVC